MAPKTTTTTNTATSGSPAAKATAPGANFRPPLPPAPPNPYVSMFALAFQGDNAINVSTWNCGPSSPPANWNPFPQQ